MKEKIYASLSIVGQKSLRLELVRLLPVLWIMREEAEERFKSLGFRLVTWTCDIDIDL